MNEGNNQNDFAQFYSFQDLKYDSAHSQILNLDTFWPHMALALVLHNIRMKWTEIIIKTIKKKYNSLLTAV